MLPKFPEFPEIPTQNYATVHLKQTVSLPSRVVRAVLGGRLVVALYGPVLASGSRS
jgi:hypothetical protein